MSITPASFKTSVEDGHDEAWPSREPGQRPVFALEGRAPSRPLTFCTRLTRHTVPSVILFLFSCLLCVPASLAQQEIGIEQAISYALKQNRSLALLRIASRSSGIALDDAEAQFKFNLTPQATSQNSGDSVSTDYGLAVSRKTVLGTTAEISGDMAATKYGGGTNYYRNTITFSIDQPLLKSAGILVNREPVTAAESQLAATRRQVEMNKTDLTVQVADTYEQMLQLQTQIDLQKTAVGRLERLFKLTQAKERQSRASHTDSLRAEIKLGEGRLLMTQLYDRLKSTKADFAELLGFAPDVEFKATPYPVPLVSVTGLESAVAIALTNRLDYAQVLQDNSDAKRGVQIAKRNLLPDLGVQTSYQLNGDGDTGSAASKLDNHVWFVGLTMKSDLPLRSERNALRQAETGADGAAIRIDAMRDAIAKQVLQTISTYDRSKAEIAIAEKNYKLARGRVSAARRMFERGRGDSFTVSDAEDELRDAEATWLNTQTQTALTAYYLLRVTGTLIEYPADLKPGAVK